MICVVWAAGGLYVLCEKSMIRKQKTFYLFSSWTIEVSLCPLITICCSFSCFATWMIVKSRTLQTQFIWNKHHPLKNRYNLHLWRRSLRLQSMFWKKRHRSQAWKRCRRLRGPGHLRQSRMTLAGRSSNKVHQLGRHEPDHLTLRPMKKKKKKKSFIIYG